MSKGLSAARKTYQVLVKREAIMKALYNQFDADESGALGPSEFECVRSGGAVCREVTLMSLQGRVWLPRLFITSHLYKVLYMRRVFIKLAASDT